VRKNNKKAKVPLEKDDKKINRYYLKGKVAKNAC